MKVFNLSDVCFFDCETTGVPAKETDSRTANWDGLGQVELDAVKPEKLIAMLNDAIGEIFDNDLYDELQETEDDERELFQTELRRYVTEEI